LDQPNEQDWFCYLLSRGVEVLDAENNTINTIPNSVLLHKLIFPTESESLFQLEKIQTFQNPEYRSNSWLVKINSNGKYVSCPTYDGNVYFFDLKTGQVSAILRDHDEIEVRDCLFHPYRDLFFTCADDGKVLVYSRDVNIEP
jgi:WD40 repeat protein